MKRLNPWFAFGFAVAGGAALSALAITGCGGGGSGGGSPADASTDTSIDTGVAVDSSAHLDAGADVTPAPCPVDASILTPVDAAANPTTAACQACLANPASMVPTGSGSGTCLANLQACNEDCTCREAVLSIGLCLNDGGTAAFCVFTNAPDGGDIPFEALLACQLGPCKAACTGSVDAGHPDGGDAGDAGHTDASAEASTTDAAVDAAPDVTTDGAPTDAAAADASTTDADTADASGDATSD
jgi:hypothetical protein